MSEEKLALLKKVGNAFLKTFRGLIAENKNGEWEISKGNVAFWVVLGHCMYIWNSVTESIVEGVTTVIRGNVSDGELYTLWGLLGYAGFKIGTDMVKTSVNTWKNGGDA